MVLGLGAGVESLRTLVFQKSTELEGLFLPHVKITAFEMDVVMLVDIC